MRSVKCAADYRIAAPSRQSGISPATNHTCACLHRRFQPRSYTLMNRHQDSHHLEREHGHLVRLTLRFNGGA